jgi:glycosyltransferase involved in cell wall biosynthesis
MRVCMVADPALLRRPGGWQVQVDETMAALARLRERERIDLRLELKDAHALAPSGCDVLHVFGTAGGNGRVVAEAAQLRLPVLLSARVACGWTRSNGSRARVADRVLGNRTDWDFDTDYARVRRALQDASLIAAVSASERKAICDAFLIEPAKVREVPNAAGAQFFCAAPGWFRERNRIAGQFALMVGDVSPYNGQLGVAQLLAALALPLVVVGDARDRDAAYLCELRKLRTVTCLGALGHHDPLLASAYAAASVFILCSSGAPLPMAALEALAAGTPVVSAGRPAATLAGGEFAFRQLGAGQPEALQREVAALLAAPPQRARVRALAEPFTWERVAAQLLDCYRALAAGRTG